jgi:hypothetical protein
MRKISGKLYAYEPLVRPLETPLSAVVKQYHDTHHFAQFKAAAGKPCPPVSAESKWGFQERSNLLQKSAASQKTALYYCHPLSTS